MRYAGHAVDFDDVIFDGSLEDLAFAGYYVKGDKVLAVTTIGKDPVATKTAELMRLGQDALRFRDQVRAVSYGPLILS